MPCFQRTLCLWVAFPKRAKGPLCNDAHAHIYHDPNTGATTDVFIMSLSFPIIARLKDGSSVQLVSADERDVQPLKALYRIIVEEGTSYPHDRFPDDEEILDYWFRGKQTVAAYVPDREGAAGMVGARFFASAEIDALPCSAHFKVIRKATSSVQSTFTSNPPPGVPKVCRIAALSKTIDFRHHDGAFP